jgi:hypothetical protein
MYRLHLAWLAGIYFFCERELVCPRISSQPGAVGDENYSMRLSRASHLLRSWPSLGESSGSYFLGILLSANFTAVSSASPALTFTSGSTPTSAQSDFEKGLMAFV